MEIKKGFELIMSALFTSVNKLNNLHSSLRLDSNRESVERNVLIFISTPAPRLFTKLYFSFAPVFNLRQVGRHKAWR